MRDTMGIILANDEKIPPVTDRRAIAALPIAGRYRVIDFVLSNMANAGVINIGIATETNYLSLMEHVKLGKPWDLDRKKQGLRIIPPNLANLSYGTNRGDIDMLYGIQEFIARSTETYVILSMGNTINNIDFKAALDAHIETQADITMLYRDMTGADERELSRFNLIDMDKDGRVIDIEVKPYYPKTAWAGMDIYIMEKALLESIIDECVARGDHDFIKDALNKKLQGMRVFGYKIDGYSDKIDSLGAYYRNSMMFLEQEVREELFNTDRPIYTKTKDQPPTQYAETAVVENCFISDGCVIEGEVYNSVLSRGVHVAKGACVRNSVIMQGTVIEEGASLDYVVLDKEVHVSAGKTLVGQESYPIAVGKQTKI